MVGHFDQAVGEPAVELSVVALAIALREWLERSPNDGATFRVEHASDPQDAAIAGLHRQRASLGHLRLIGCVTVRVSSVAVVMAEIAEATDAEVFRLAQEG